MTISAALHVRIVRPVAPLGACPIDVLAWVFDIAGFAMHAVLEVDDKLLFAVFFDHFVNARRAIPLCGFCVFRQVDPDRDACVFEVQMHGLAFFMVSKAEGHVGQAIKRQFAVRFWVFDFWVISRKARYLGVGFTVR